MEFNALNTQVDIFMPKPYREHGKADWAWTIEGLQSAVHLDGTLNNDRDTDRGWTIEIAIPWKSLAKLTSDPLPPKENAHWAMQLARIEHEDENDKDGTYFAWVPAGVKDLHRPDLWGRLEFSN
jgi:hypothetical protein